MKKNVHICVTESLCCTAEINTVHFNYASKKKKFFFFKSKQFQVPKRPHLVCGLPRRRETFPTDKIFETLNMFKHWNFTLQLPTTFLNPIFSHHKDPLWFLTLKVCLCQCHTFEQFFCNYLMYSPTPYKVVQS